MLEEAGMTTYETATTPGTAANKASNDDSENTPVNKKNVRSTESLESFNG